ncbi:hypothetical protein [Pseudomonas sp. H3_G03]
MSRQPALPKIEVTKVGKLFRVDWDYQEAPESNALHRESDYLWAYLKGVLDALDISEEQRVCSAGRVGTIKSLNESVANKLADILRKALTPMVEAEYKRLAAQERLPLHLRNSARLEEL